MSVNNQAHYYNCIPTKQPAGYPSYTYHLPYTVRKEICNLLDADHSWKTLGGRYMGLDGTQLALIGQALMRKESPTEELLNKLDSANVRIVDLSLYLKQMNQFRAFEILKPFMIEGCNANATSRERSSSTNTTDDTGMLSGGGGTLHTPTPSFGNSTTPYAIMGPSDVDSFIVDNSSIRLQQYGIGNQSQMQQDMAIQEEDVGYNEAADSKPPSKCHRSNNQPPPPIQPALQYQSPIRQQDVQDKPDPGEEIVRKACAVNRKRTSISDQEVVNQLRLIMQITYNELKQASDNFSSSNILGNGGFASVYKGYWKGTDVAIKRLKCNLMDQALNELSILNSYKIDNILPIYGISIDGPEACLVYQFMANGSLEDRLSCKKNTPPLSWQQRASIGEGVAKGLYYLHTVRDKPLVHGDVKSANVLLDAQFLPKLGDFGLARQVFKDKNPQSEVLTHCTVSSIHGTSVYLPYEYLRHKILSPAVDAYSYGVVLLEMATGRRAYDGKRLLVDLVEEETRSISIGQIGYSLKDPRLVNDSPTDLKIWLELLIKLGISCTNKIKKKRLDMGQVLNKFVEFRTNPPQVDTDNVANNNNNSFGLVENNIEQAGALVNLDNLQGQQLGQEALNQNVYNSNLMSIDEERGAIAAQQEAASVEAMIPLLTEFGIEQNPINS